MLPSSYISAELGQKILFIGKAVKVLQQQRTPVLERIPFDELQAFSEAIIRLSNLPDFNSILFGKVIEEIRECVASRLWHLIVVKSDLISDLQAAKDYFLLAKGEFYQTFIDEGRGLM
jgi:gamma-tubulin complex component 4